MTDSENTEPTLDKPSTATDDPRRTNDLKDKDAPRWRKSMTESAEPIRAKDRRDNDAPMCAYSNTDSEKTDPILDKPRRAN
jgi:hypothetical protein